MLKGKVKVEREEVDLRVIQELTKNFSFKVGLAGVVMAQKQISFNSVRSDIS